MYVFHLIIQSDKLEQLVFVQTQDDCSKFSFNTFGRLSDETGREKKKTVTIFTIHKFYNC